MEQNDLFDSEIVRHMRDPENKGALLTVDKIPIHQFWRTLRQDEARNKSDPDNNSENVVSSLLSKRKYRQHRKR